MNDVKNILPKPTRNKELNKKLLNSLNSCEN